ncbi:MAG: succinyl-CoA--3-ketoacid-CoA transferase [Phycisphaerae bacterium]|nr:MAG: succinyl-CoA--3-ketoacid-CoA transferase [Phycisphaerae bacterium]
MGQKVFDTAPAAFADLAAKGVLRDGMTILVGGFGLCGIPEHLILALRDSGVKDLTCVSNNAGVDDWGLGLLLQTRQIRKMISSYVGENATFEKQFLSGELEVEFNPQGTLAERLRAGGAGIPAFYTATGAGTLVAEGKDTREFYRPGEAPGGATVPGRGYAGRVMKDGPSPVRLDQAEPREYVMETGLYGDLALVKAHQADPFGNLVYRKTARNFNPMMATAAAFVIAEVDEMVPLGALDADAIHTPGSYVDRVVRTVSVKRIEQRTTRVP